MNENDQIGQNRVAFGRALPSKVSVINICIQFRPKRSISTICGKEIDPKETKNEFQNDTNPDVSTTVVKDSHKLEFLTTVSDRQLPKYHYFFGNNCLSATKKHFSA